MILLQTLSLIMTKQSISSIFLSILITMLTIQPTQIQFTLRYHLRVKRASKRIIWRTISLRAKLITSFKLNRIQFASIL